MSEAVIVALISGGLSLLGIWITHLASVRRSDNTIMMAQAVTDAKLEELTREVREHNQIAGKIPVMEEQIKVINHRISDLEVYHKVVS